MGERVRRRFSKGSSPVASLASPATCVFDWRPRGLQGWNAALPSVPRHHAHTDRIHDGRPKADFHRTAKWLSRTRRSSSEPTACVAARVPAERVGTGAGAGVWLGKGAAPDGKQLEGREPAPRLPRCPLQRSPLLVHQMPRLL